MELIVRKKFICLGDSNLTWKDVPGYNGSISMVCNRKRKTAGSYVWRFKND